jgi:integrase
MRGDEAAIATARKGVGFVVAGKAPTETAAIGGETYAEIRKQLTDGKIHARFPDEVDELGDDHRKDMIRVNVNHIETEIGDFPVSTIRVEHYRNVLRKLRSNFSPARRRFIAWNMHRVLEMAVLVGAIPANPIPASLMPKLGARRARGFLFPDEDATLMQGLAPIDPDATEDEQPRTVVPLVRRLLCGVIAREGMRKEEAAGLQWSDERSADAIGTIDLARGWVRLDEHKTVDTSGARDWPLDPDVVEALKRWRTMQPKKARFVFSDDGKEAPNVDHLADQLRNDLTAVGVTRPELHVTTKARRQINAHDLRGTFVTLSLAQGRAEGWIMRRTGHTTSEMIALYRRQAENLAEGGAARLMPLWEAIPELAGVSESVSGSPDGPQGSGTPETDSSRKFSNGVRRRGLEPLRLAALEPETGKTAGHSRTWRDSADSGDHSPPHPTAADTSLTPLAAAVGALAEQVSRAVASGDMASARRLRDAMSGLLDAPDGRAAVVTDLDSHRGKRGGGTL